MNANSKHDDRMNVKGFRGKPVIEFRGKQFGKQRNPLPELRPQSVGREPNNLTACYSLRNT